MTVVASGERIAGVVALLREQADAVPEQYPPHPDDLSQHFEAREDLPRALRFGALLLEQARPPISEDDLRLFIDVFSMGIERIAELIDPVLRDPVAHWAALDDD